MPTLLIFVLIIILSSLVSRKTGPKQQERRTGTFMPPVGGKKPGRAMRSETTVKPPQPAMHMPPAQAVTKPADPIAQPPELTVIQTSLLEPLPQVNAQPSVEGHSAVLPGQYAQGDSRECEHGAVGGSMEVKQHEGPLSAAPAAARNIAKPTV